MISRFRDLYGTAEGIRVFRAPGRINLIGEHTDYNLGFVLPVALDLATFVAIAPSSDTLLRIYSEDKNEMREWDVARIPELRPEGGWTDYPIGVGRELITLGFDIAPANLLIRSTVPEGSGLSSSAALEVSTAFAFLRGRSIAPIELARLCQKAEHNFVGTPCGIMDQYISVFGHSQSAIELDCRSLEHSLVPLPPGARFVAVNTMVKHALASSAYRQRVEECAAAVDLLRRRYSHVTSLRDVTSKQLESAAGSLPPAIARRARHVVSENARVAAFVAACARNDLAAMGKLLVDSHRSLACDYEVSCAELDFLVDTSLAMKGVFGARMTGGGFGGCVIALIEPDTSSQFCDEIARVYRRQFGMVPAIYPCQPSGGAAEVKNFETIPGQI